MRKRCTHYALLMVCIASTKEICFKCWQGWYPVMYAVEAGHIELVKECFDKVEHAITTKVYCVALHVYQCEYATDLCTFTEKENSVAYSC